MQIKTTMMYHLTLVRLTIMKKLANSKYWRGCGKRGTLLHCWWDCKFAQPLWRTVWKFLKKKTTKNWATMSLAIFWQNPTNSLMSFTLVYIGEASSIQAAGREVSLGFEGPYFSQWMAIHWIEYYYYYYYYYYFLACRSVESTFLGWSLSSCSTAGHSVCSSVKWT